LRSAASARDGLGILIYHTAWRRGGPAARQAVVSPATIRQYRADFMLRQSASDQEIRNWVLRHHGLKIEIAWIADCKLECGIQPDDLQSLQQVRFSPCPPEKRPAIKQAFRHFGMLST
jgi:hypothetical protein